MVCIQIYNTNDNINFICIAACIPFNNYVVHYKLKGLNFFLLLVSIFMYNLDASQKTRLFITNEVLF